MKSFLLFLLGSIAIGFPGRGQDIDDAKTFVRWVGSPFEHGQVDAAGLDARFSDVDGIASDREGFLYVADRLGQTIRKISPESFVTTLAGMAFGNGPRDGTGSEARFFYPHGISVDADGTIYVSELDQFLRKISPTGVVTTPPLVDAEATGSDRRAHFTNPWGLAFDSHGDLYVGDSFRVRKVTKEGIVFTWAGTLGSPGTADGLGQDARFGGSLKGLAFDADDNLYVSDTENDTIRKITPARVVTTIAGKAGLAGNSDGTGESALFEEPTGVAVDREGNLFVVDFGNEALRKISPEGVVTTVTTRESQGATQVGFGFSGGIAIRPDGSLFVTGEHVIWANLAPVNIWESDGNGRWQDGTKWSSGVPAVDYSAHYLTNAGTKAVLIDASTVADSPESLNIRELYLTGSDGDINAVVLTDSGLANPLKTERIVIDHRARLFLTNAALKAELGMAVGFNAGQAEVEVRKGRLDSIQTYVGFDDLGHNLVWIHGPAAEWINKELLMLGLESDSNGVVIEDGAAATTAGPLTIGDGRYENRGLVSGVGSLWQNTGTVTVGIHGGSANGLTAAAGGMLEVRQGSLRIGEASDQNFVEAGDAGSILKVSGDVIVGPAGGNGNWMTFVDGAEATIGGSLRIGDGGSSNVVVIDHATLICSGAIQLTTGAGPILNALLIGEGSRIQALSLSVSGSNAVALAGGSLETGSTLIDNGEAFLVGNGSNSSELKLNGGEHRFNAGLKINNNGRVTGCGKIFGNVTIDAGGLLIVDCGGPMVIDGDLINNGSILLLNGSSVQVLGQTANNGTTEIREIAASACDTVSTGIIEGLMEGETYRLEQGPNFVELNWSVAGPGRSGFVYATQNTQGAVASGITSVNDVTDASTFDFALNYLDNRGPANDAEANGGTGQLIVLRNKNSGHYALIRLDDVRDDGSLDATWWFQNAGGGNFSCSDPNSLPAVESLGIGLSNGSLRLQFQTVVGIIYTVETKSDLGSDSWKAQTVFVGNGSVKGVSLTDSGAHQAFYRVKAE